MSWWAILVCATSTALAAPAGSNPAFLGIGPLERAAKGCIAAGVAPDGAAAEAGMVPGDVVLAIDAVPLDPKRPCDHLAAAVSSHMPGDTMRIDIMRGMRNLAVAAVLTTRADVLRAKVGHRIVSTTVTDFDDKRRQFDLVERGRRPVVLGFFLPQCLNCGRVLESVVDGVRRRTGTAMVRGVVPRMAHDDTTNVRGAIGVSLPLAIIGNDDFDSLSIADPDRVFFLVIDRAGAVRAVVPVEPEADDRDASIEEVLVAAQQAEHARTERW